MKAAVMEFVMKQALGGRRASCHRPASSAARGHAGRPLSGQSGRAGGGACWGAVVSEAGGHPSVGFRGTKGQSCW